MTQVLHEPAVIPSAAVPPAAAPSSGPFHSDEIKELQSADWKAAAMVAGLMVGIFTLGMVMYLYIFYCATAGPP